MSYQQRLFDGYTVSHERGTLSAFTIEDEDIRHFKADDVVVLVVTATVGGAAFKHDVSGDWLRVNKLTAHEVRVAEGVMKEEIVEFYNLAGDQLAFARPGGSASSVSSGPAQGSAQSGSTHVDPSVASAGNTPNADEEEDDDQDFSNGQASPDGQADPVLAAFLNEPGA
jgi:hypothetical protein